MDGEYVDLESSKTMVMEKESTGFLSNIKHSRDVKKVNTEHCIFIWQDIKIYANMYVYIYRNKNLEKCFPYVKLTTLTVVYNKFTKKCTNLQKASD